MSINTVLFLTIVTYATIFDQVASSYSWGPITIPTMPSMRSFFWSNPAPPEKVEEMARLQAAETQNKIAQTQNSLAQTQNCINNQVKKVQDDISKRVNDVGVNVVDFTTPGTRRKVIVSDEGMTEEIEANFQSPDGSTRGYSKASVTTFGNKWK